MTKVQKLSCEKITRKLMSFPIAYMFIHPVDRLDAPDYYEKVKKPVDLSKVLSRLSENQYPTVDEWKKDVNLIWRNALTYYTGDDTMRRIAHELQDAFKKLCECIPKTELELWTLRVRKAHAKLAKLIAAKPEPQPALALIPAGAPKPRKTKVLLRQNSNTH